MRFLLKGRQSQTSCSLCSTLDSSISLAINCIRQDTTGRVSSRSFGRLLKFQVVVWWLCSHHLILPSVCNRYTWYYTWMSRAWKRWHLVWLHIADRRKALHILDPVCPHTCTCPPWALQKAPLTGCGRGQSLTAASGEQSYAEVVLSTTTTVGGGHDGKAECLCYILHCVFLTLHVDEKPTSYPICRLIQSIFAMFAMFAMPGRSCQAMFAWPDSGASHPRPGWNCGVGVHHCAGVWCGRRWHCVFCINFLGLWTSWACFWDLKSW